MIIEAHEDWANRVDKSYMGFKPRDDESKKEVWAELFDNQQQNLRSVWFRTMRTPFVMEQNLMQPQSLKPRERISTHRLKIKLSADLENTFDDEGK